MRPNVGRTERSQPKTSPMISAPPLAVRLRGRPPTVTERRPRSRRERSRGRRRRRRSRSTASRCSREPFRRARCPSASRDLEEVAPVHDRTGREGHFLGPRTCFTRTMPRPCSSARSASVRSAARVRHDSVHRRDRKVEKLPDRVSRRRRRRSARNGRAAGPRRRRRPPLASNVSGAASRSVSPRRRRSTKTRSGAKDASKSDTRRPSRDSGRT